MKPKVMPLWQIPVGSIVADGFKPDRLTKKGLLFGTLESGITVPVTREVLLIERARRGYPLPKVPKHLT